MCRTRLRTLNGLLIVALLCTSFTGLFTRPAVLAATPTPAVTATPVPNATPSAPVNTAGDQAMADARLAQTLDNLPAIKKLVEKIGRQLDRSQVTLDDLALALGGDADALVDWVRREVAFEQYPGVLNGAEGTLIGRAGNALDTAMLLAQLLADAGYEARIAHATLPAASARVLVNQMMAPRPAAPALGDDAALRALLIELGQAFGLSAAESKEQVQAALLPATAPDPRFADAQKDADFILATLDNAGIELGDPAAIDAVVAEATDYFWVQYRLSVGQPWQAAHPAFKDEDAAPKQLIASETFLEDVPATLFHRIRLEVSIEQKIDDQLSTAVVMPAWEQPVANLVGRPLVYRNNPISLQNLEELLDVEVFLAKPTTFIPSFNNELVLEGQGFDLNGTAYAVGLLGTDTLALTQVGQSIGNALEEAVGALDTPDEDAAAAIPSDLITLTAQWIDYTLIAPDGRERTFRRTVLDRIGADNRSTGIVAIAPGQEFPAAAASLLTQHTILVLPSVYSHAYVAHRFLSQMKVAVEMLDYLHKAMPFTEQFVPPPMKLLTASTPFDDVVLNTLFARNPAVDATAEPQRISYRAEPYLVILEDGVLLNRPEPTGFLRVDIINNTRRSFVVKDGELQADVGANILAGAWETQAEQSPFAEVNGERFSTMVAFLSAAQADLPIQVVTPDDRASLADMPLPTVARLAIERDLDRGYVVIVPETIASGDGAAGWWRVNPSTGETLGLAGEGRGDSAVEYSFLLGLKENLILGAPSALAGFAICMRGASGSAGCCAADAAAAYGAGAGLGAAVAYKSVVAAILLGEALKIGGIVGGMTGATPSFCNL